MIVGRATGSAKLGRRLLGPTPTSRRFRPLHLRKGAGFRASHLAHDFQRGGVAAIKGEGAVITLGSRVDFAERAAVP